MKYDFHGLSGSRHHAAVKDVIAPDAFEMLA